MKYILPVFVLLASAAIGYACVDHADCAPGTVCCKKQGKDEGECHTGSVCCSYGACPSEESCCTAKPELWPACCDPGTSICCKNYGANWCCPNTKTCGSYYGQCKAGTTTTTTSNPDSTPRPSGSTTGNPDSTTTPSSSTTSKPGDDKTCLTDTDCKDAGTVCCKKQDEAIGMCHPGTVCCSYGACPSSESCCTARNDLWPSCCDPETSICCKNHGANWCCANTYKCGTFWNSCVPKLD